MKKSTLALAVAAALTGFGTVAQADTTLYGSARVSIDYVDVDKPDGPFSLNSNDSWDVRNNSSRLGVRGLEDLGGGLSAIYQYEFGVDLTEGGNFESNRPKWVGLKGGFGSVTAGTQWSAYYNVTGVADIFNSNRSFASDTGYLGGQWGARLDNSILYTSPDMSGFKAQAMLIMNSTDTRVPNVSDSVDLWQLGFNYSNGPIYAGAAYMQLSNSDEATFNGDDASQWALVGAYKPGPFSVGLLYEQGDLNTVSLSPLVDAIPLSDIDDTWSIYLFGSYTFGNNEIKAAYGFMEPEGDYVLDVANARRQSYDGIQNLLLSYQYNFSKRTRVWFEYLGRNDDNDGVISVVKGDQNVISIGTRHDF
jgi:predicted porin